MLKGVSIKLIELVEVGKDEFNKTIYTENIKIVDNVLISPSSSEDITTSTNLIGKKSVYTLAIPKNDDNKWEDNIVEFFNQRWKVFKITTQGLDHLIPLQWNKKVMVERYEV